LNIHVCLQLHIIGEAHDWILRISFVGPYACLLRVNPAVLQNPLKHHKIITSKDVGKNQAWEEKFILDSLHAHNITLLDKAIMEMPISLKLHDTDPEYVRMYHALFEDTEILPPWE